jgi:hypothetical protein
VRGGWLLFLRFFAVGGLDTLFGYASYVASVLAAACADSYSVEAGAASQREE